MNFEVYESKVTEVFTPSRPLEFINGKCVIFQYTPPQSDVDGFVKLPQVPYEIKEHALKGFTYTFMLTMVCRFISATSYALANPFTFNYSTLLPAGVFAFHFLKPLYLMHNAVVKVELLEDGETIRLSYKNTSTTRDVKINQLIKKEKENFLVECYTEPFLFPMQINYSEKYGKYSLFSHKRFYLYGDSHSTIKNGEVLRAIINGQNISI